MATCVKSSASASDRVISRIEISDPIIALTYDDGPTPEFTSAILEILDAHQAQATFFCVGQQLKKHGALTKQAFYAGHEIGNHSYSHPDLGKADRKTIISEIKKTDELIFSITGNPAPLIRPPFGSSGPVFNQWLEEDHRLSILFDVAPTPPDYRGADPILITDSIRQQVRPGSIVVLHDGGKENKGDRASTVEATRYLVPILKSKGYRFATVSELIARKRCVERDSNDIISPLNEEKKQQAKKANHKRMD